MPVSATPKPAVNGTTENAAAALPASTIQQQQRLPHDKVGRLEDRIKEDPKADIEAWWELIQHYQEKDQLDNARAVYARMVEVWPTSVRKQSPRIASDIRLASLPTHHAID